MFAFETGLPLLDTRFTDTHTRAAIKNRTIFITTTKMGQVNISRKHFIQNTQMLMVLKLLVINKAIT